MSRRACGRPIPAAKSGTGQPTTCDLERMKGKQRCHWHWLLSQSSDTQAAYAVQRRDRWAAPSRTRVPDSEWPDGHRWCAGCQSFVPLFYVTGSRCKACSSMAAHERRVESIYGITAEEYDAIFERQGRRCAICRSQPRTIRFAVDHDHQSGEVRGILCKRCNHDLLGGGHDDVETLFRALEYLLFPPARCVARPTREEVWEALSGRLDLRAQLAAPRRPEPQPAPF